jgi:hypothetical protein
MNKRIPCCPVAAPADAFSPASLLLFLRCTGGGDFEPCSQRNPVGLLLISTSRPQWHPRTDRYCSRHNGAILLRVADR